jgi:DNA-binding FadR family transcriptional regulator
MRSTSGEKLTENEIKKIQAYKDDIENHIKQRTLQNKMDLAFFKKIEKRASG